MSHHLRILREAGLVVDRRAGRWVHYAVAEPALASCKLLLYELEPLRGGAARTRELSGTTRTRISNGDRSRINGRIDSGSAPQSKPY